jgi:hypothetical protein
MFMLSSLSDQSLFHVVLGDRFKTPQDVSKAKGLTQDQAAVLKRLLGPLDKRNSAAALLQLPMFQLTSEVRQCQICLEEHKLETGKN